MKIKNMKTNANQRNETQGGIEAPSTLMAEYLERITNTKQIRNLKR